MEVYEGLEEVAQNGDIFVDIFKQLDISWYYNMEIKVKPRGK